MHYAPDSETCPLPFSSFKACTVPRPIGWLSTISPDGVHNLAPYSQWQNLTFDPPMVMFAANQYPDGRRKDTVVNAEQTGWFVWNMATYDLREAVNISAMALPPDEDEFERAGITKADCIDAPGARVAESPCHFECRYLSTHRLPGNSPVGGVDVVYGQVMRIHVADRVILPSGKINIANIRPIARMGYYDYATITDIFEMRIPSASGAAEDGLEGKPQSVKKE
jgi:flavin reductase (DIM6/NTAB) family NADH-FMN oxidoreductase RutF